MRISLLVLSAIVVACAGPQIPPDPVIPPAPAAYHGPVLQPCVLVHQEFEADRSAALQGGGDGKVKLAFASIVVRHPTKGVVVIDPAIGREKEHDFGEMPWIMRRQVGDGSKAVALGDLLTAIAIPPDSVKWALVTHIHYDHIGGATDIPNAQILIREPDPDWAAHAHLLFYDAVPHDMVDRIRPRLKPFRTDGSSYEGFAGSYDVFGDGSIIGVPTPGHTPGSVSWFVNSGDGRRWLFVGDSGWLLDGVQRPAHKGWMGRLVDDNTKDLSETLARLHAFQKARPVTTPPDGVGVQVIVAHDPEGLSTLPRCTTQ